MTFRPAANAIGLLTLGLAACSSGVVKDPAQALREEVPASAALLDRGAGTAWATDESGRLIARPGGEAKQDLPEDSKAIAAHGPAVSIALGASYEDGVEISLAGANAFGLRVVPRDGSGAIQLGADGVARVAGIRRQLDSVYIASAGA